MREAISGFEVSGTWEEIVEHGERITEALRDAGVTAESLTEWQSWRPKATDRIDAEMSEKTAAQASVAEGAGERADASPGDDLRTAGEKATDGIDDVRERDPAGGAARGRDSVDHAARAADSAGRKLLRTIESVVYERLMTRVAPYYFDSELVSANLRRTEGNDEEFTFEVNVNDDDLKADVSDRLAAYDEAEGRWHGGTEPATEVAEVAEGVDAPPSTRGPASPTEGVEPAASTEPADAANAGTSAASNDRRSAA